VGLKGGVNIYIYANMNAILNIDHKGLWIWSFEEDDYSVCSYYDEVVNKYDCTYHKNAARICRFENGVDSYLANGWIRFCSFVRSIGSTEFANAENRNCIRRCLAKKDAEARRQDDCRIYSKGGDNCGPKGCIKRQCIDTYHNLCFMECNISRLCYGGNYPYEYDADD
jgi:hypothetical protein